MLKICSLMAGMAGGIATILNLMSLFDEFKQKRNAELNRENTRPEIQRELGRMSKETNG